MTSAGRKEHLCQVPNLLPMSKTIVPPDYSPTPVVALEYARCLADATSYFLPVNAGCAQDDRQVSDEVQQYESVLSSMDGASSGPRPVKDAGLRVRRIPLGFATASSAPIAFASEVDCPLRVVHAHFAYRPLTWPGVPLHRQFCAYLP